MSTPIARSRTRFGPTVCLSMIALLATAASLTEAGQSPIDIPGRARGAERVVVATVARVEPIAVRNEFGDVLIVSRTTWVIEEVLKGPASPTLTLDIEGGSLGGLTLHVSDLPSVSAGERAVVFVSRSRAGPNVPHLRGAGILKLDDSNVVIGTDLALDTIRAEIGRL